MKKLFITLLCLITMFGCTTPNQNIEEPNQEEQTNETQETRITFFQGLQTSFYLTGDKVDKFIEYFNNKEVIDKELPNNDTLFFFNYEGEDYYCYPYYDEIYFKSMQTQKVYVIEDRFIVSKLYSLMPTNFITTINQFEVEQPIQYIEYDPNVLTPITLEEGHIFKDETNDGDMGGSGYTSMYLYYSGYLEILNNQVVITNYATMKSFIVNQIVNPVSLAYRGSCGGPMDMAVLTAQNEMYILEGFASSYESSEYTMSHKLDVYKVETDQPIKEIQVHHDIDVFTTCGNARYYALTEEGDLRSISQMGNKNDHTIKSYTLGKTRDVIHPYSDFLIADTSYKTGEDEHTNMFYLFKDNTLHTGYMIDYDWSETWSNDPVLDKDGNIFYVDSCFKLYTTNHEVTDFYILGQDGYLYTFDYKNANFREQPTLELRKVTEFKVINVEVSYTDDESTNTRTTEVIFTLEQNQSIRLLSNYINGIGYSKYNTNNNN